MALGVGSGSPTSRRGGARGFHGRFKTRNRRGESTKDLGKWVNGKDGRLTEKYIAWRKTRRQMERRSRSETHREKR